MNWKSINFITISPPHVTSKLISIEVFFFSSYCFCLLGKYPETWDNNDDSNTYQNLYSVCEECTYNWWDFCLMLSFMFNKIINANMDISHLYTFCILKWIPIDYFFAPSTMFIISLSHQSWLIIKVFTVLCGRTPLCIANIKLPYTHTDQTRMIKKIQYELYTDMQFEFDRVRRLHMEEAQFE